MEEKIKNDIEYTSDVVREMAREIIKNNINENLGYENEGTANLGAGGRGGVHDARSRIIWKEGGWKASIMETENYGNWFPTDTVSFSGPNLSAFSISLEPEDSE